MSIAVHSRLRQPLTLLQAAALALIWAGCATPNLASYDALNRKRGADGPAAALAQSVATPLQRGVELLTELSPDAPIANLAKGRSHYRVVSATLRQGHRYVLEVSSYCDCVGIRKTLVRPIVYHAGLDGKPHLNEPVKQVERPAGLRPHSLYGVWVLEPKESGVHLFLVASDNEQRGVAAHAQDQRLGRNQSFVLVTAPYGEVSITLRQVWPPEDALGQNDP